MDLEYVIQQAENGNVDAMVALGNHYFEGNKLSDAFDWYHKAAKCGNIHSIKCAAHIASVMAISIEATKDWDSAFQCWTLAGDICNMLEEHPDATEKDFEMIDPINNDSLYGKGLALFRMEKYEFARQFLEYAVKYEVVGAKITLGLCIFDMKISAQEPPQKVMQEVYPYLEEAADVDAGTSSIKSDLLFRALMTLALIYRLGVAGGAADVEKAYQCVVTATQLPDGLGAAARDELKHYQKGLFGYRYKE